MKCCPNFGQPSKLKRIDGHYISYEIQYLLHLEKGFFYTAKKLLTRPVKSIREFIDENMNKHMKPIAFLIPTPLLYTLIGHFSPMLSLVADQRFTPQFLKSPLLYTQTIISKTTPPPIHILSIPNQKYLPQLYPKHARAFETLRGHVH